MMLIMYNIHADMTRGVLIQARHCGFYRFRNIGQFTTNICIITYRNYIFTLKIKIYAYIYHIRWKCERGGGFCSFRKRLDIKLLPLPRWQCDMKVIIQLNNTNNKRPRTVQFWHVKDIARGFVRDKSKRCSRFCIYILLS